MKIITAVSAEPVSRAQAKLHIGLDDISGSHPDDSEIDDIIVEAREFAEQYTGRGLAGRTLELALDAFPCDDGGAIVLPLGPVATVTHIKYTDGDGVEQTVSSANYALSLYGNNDRIDLAYGASWPATRSIVDAVRVRYVTGYAATGQGTGYTALPKAAKQGLLAHIKLTYPRSALTPSQREALEMARDVLLGTIKNYGRAA